MNSFNIVVKTASIIFVFLGVENLSLIFSNSSLIKSYKAFLELIIFLKAIIDFDNLLISVSISPIPKAVSFCNLNSRIASTCSIDN